MRLTKEKKYKYIFYKKFSGLPAVLYGWVPPTPPTNCPAGMRGRFSGGIPAIGRPAEASGNGRFSGFMPCIPYTRTKNCAFKFLEQHRRR
jgi:hypothetical protein